MKALLSLFFVCFTFSNMLWGQMSSTEVLEKSIAYHDPNNQWNTFEGAFQVTMNTPNGADRVSDIEINLPEEYFKVNSTRDTTQVFYEISKGACNTNLPSKGDQRRTPCETAELYKNYYTYLYGLPMKLRDLGTQLSETAETVSFKGKTYVRFKVTYTEDVGKDIWFFYFNPETYALEIYQFYKGDPDGAGKDTGEYILLSEESTVSGIKMPKVRAWYYNKGDTYLGTDTITGK